MFTGIVQGVAIVARRLARPGLVTFELQFPAGFLDGVEIGASIAVDGVCLTVTAFDGERAHFDVMQQTLNLTTLQALNEGDRVNIERAAREGAEVGGHVLSGHVDLQATLAEIRQPENNHVLRFAVPAPWMRYIFAKGYIAVNGASLTVAEAHHAADGAGWFEVWLIPETLRMTTFGRKAVGDAVNLEIERATQVMVDTVRRAVDEQLNERLEALLGPLRPLLQDLARERGIELP
jgi:riboflavin synthase